MKKSRLLSIACAFTLTVLATTTNASLVVPAGLNPGDAYRVIFVSSTPIDGASSNIVDYDAHVQAAADAAGIGGALQWISIVSTTSESAFNHVTNFVSADSNVPIFNQMGQLIASTASDLWSGISTAVMYDEKGSMGHGGMWTGTDIGGAAFINRELGSSAPEIGLSTSDTSQWLTWMASTSTAEMHALYGLSATITVTSIPVPAAVWLLGSGLLSLFWVGLDKRKNN